MVKNLVDLHLHLGASSTPHFLWELAHEQGIRLAEKDYFSFINSITIREKTTYDNYLKFFDITELIQSSTYAIEKAAHEAVSRAYRKGNVTTIEIRFNPMLRNRGGEQDLDKIIFGAAVGMKKACLEYPVRAGLILMMDRRFPKEKNLIIAKKAIRFAAEGVVGLDIAGPLTKGFRVEDLVEPVRVARSAGLGITIHTGEVTGPEEIWQVVKLLTPERIGHGIRSVGDSKLLDELAKRKVVLEVCPMSNIQTNAVRDWKEMGNIIDALKQHGVPFTINSDGPELLGTTVAEEFEKLMEKGILTKEDIASCIKRANNATFIR
ncbi:adenosine deaminase [Candidatus Gottesmanbacteria bacterium]|nr:adenosine deaminase [Candidatus Gottesmanbacteria bacterium]